MKFQLLIVLMAVLAATMGGSCDMSPSIKDIKAKYEAQLLQMPGVVSVGIGSNESGQAVIVIGLESSNPETESKLPKSLEGYPVTVHTVGKIVSQ